MKILLLNENPMVSRLINLSAKKMSYELIEAPIYNDELGTYDIIVVDHDVKADLKALKEKCDKLIFLAPRDEKHDIEAQILKKPFLPTDFLNLLTGKVASLDDVISVDPLDESSSNTNMDLDSDLNGLPDESDDLSLDSLSLDEEEQVAIAQKAHSDEESKETDSQSLVLDENEDLNLDESLGQAQENGNLIGGSGSDEAKASEDLGSQEEEVDSEKQGGKGLDSDDEGLGEVESENETKVEKHAAEEDSDIQGDLKQSEENAPILDEDKGEFSEKGEDESGDEKEDGDFKVQALEEENLEGEQSSVPTVESQEKEMDFDDLPQDAEFLGQKKEDFQGEEFLPFVEDEILESKDEVDSSLSVQDKIKEELAQLDELDDPINEESGSEILKEFKDEAIFKEEELGIGDEEVVVPSFEPNDFDDLKESEIQEVLGEKVSEVDNEGAQTQIENSKGEEIMDELSQSIAQTIASSIKDNTLKAALKGMNMNINIKISFDEGK